MQKSIGKCRFLPKVRGLSQQVFQWMSWRQRPERTDKIPNLLICGMDAEPSAEFLQHIDACPSVRCINHKMHRSVRFEHTAQSFKSCIRISKMMENPGAYNLIEARPQIIYTLNGKLIDLQIV